MSYALLVYKVEQSILDSTLGSGNLALLDRLSNRDRLNMMRHDEHFSAETADGDPSLEEALRQLLTGESEDADDAGYAYGYAFEVLCGLVGQQLASDSFQGMSISWLDTVDECLAALDAPDGLRINSLMDGYTPGFPSPGDFPGTGRWAAEVIVEGREWFTGMDISAQVEEPTLVSALQEIEGWLGRCGGGEVLVGFVY